MVHNCHCYQVECSEEPVCEDRTSEFHFELHHPISTFFTTEPILQQASAYVQRQS